MNQSRSIYLGFDRREASAYAVARHGVNRWLTQPIPVMGLVLSDLRAQGLYRRPHENRWHSIPSGTQRQLWDVISGAPMSTEFAITRFLTPWLAQTGWALFMDCDVLVRDNLTRLFEHLENNCGDYAVMCVQHEYAPQETIKMDGQIQTRYARKNWSSVMAFNCDHPANKSLTLDLINNAAGRELHAFCWLDDRDIGSLDPAYNYLVGHTQNVSNPKIVHFTEGLPYLPGYENCEYANEWFDALDGWAL